MFGHCIALNQLGWRRHPDKFNFTSTPPLSPPFSISQNPAKDHYGVLACQKYTVAALKLCGPTSYSSTLRISNTFFFCSFFVPILSERRIRPYIIKKDSILISILILGQCKGASILLCVSSQVSTSFFFCTL